MKAAIVMPCGGGLANEITLHWARQQGWTILSDHTAKPSWLTQEDLWQPLTKANSLASFSRLYLADPHSPKSFKIAQKHPELCWPMILDHQHKPLIWFVKKYSLLFHSLAGLIFYAPLQRADFEHHCPIPDHLKVEYLALTRQPEQKTPSASPYFLVAPCLSGTPLTNQTLGPGIDLKYLTPSSANSIDLLAGCCALIAPDTIENFSLAVFIAWQMKKAVIGDQTNGYLRQWIDQTQGGLFFNSRQMLSGLTEWCQTHQTSCRQIGHQGYRYTQQQLTVV